MIDPDVRLAVADDAAELRGLERLARVQVPSPACGDSSVVPHRTMLYSRAHAFPSSMSAHVSRGTPPPSENSRA